MSLTPEQFYKTIEGTPDAQNFDIPPAPVVEEPTTNTPSAEEVTPSNTETNKPEQGGEPPKSPEQQPAAAPVFNLDEELVKITGGAIKSKDDIAALLETSKKAIELETQLKTYQEENTNLKGKVDVNPFANDFTKKLNDLYASNATDTQIQAFMAINKVDLDQLTPLQTSSLALQIKHGLTPDEAIVYLNNKYGIDPEEPNATLDKNAEIALKIDSGVDREFLKTHKAEVSQAPVDQSAQQERLIQEQSAQKIQQLTPIANSVISDVLSNSFKGISINGKEGKDAITVDLPISEESRSKLAQQVSEMITNNWDGIPTDEKGKQAIKTFAENVLWLQNKEAMLIDVASKTELRVRAEYNNPSPIDRGNAAEQQGRTKGQERVDSITKALQLAGEI